MNTQVFLPAIFFGAMWLPMHAAEQPNILWLVSEDHSPMLDCYGDSVARTPNLDALAARSLRFTMASSNAPVSAPARTTLISGMYASSTGSDHGPYYSYQQKAQSSRVWHRQWVEGKLDEIRSAYWRPHPAEELFDLQDDPDETRNLVGSPAHAELLRELRAVLRQHLLETRDLVLMPEPMMHGLLAARAGATAWDLARDAEAYPMEAALDLTDLQLGAQPDLVTIRKAMGAPSAVVRYWAVAEVLHRGGGVAAELMPDLCLLLKDSDALIRVMAAEALGRTASSAEALEMLIRTADSSRTDLFTVIHAMNALDHLTPLPPRAAERLRAFTVPNDFAPEFAKSYFPRLVEHILAGN